MCTCAGATALGKLHMVNLAASELAEREGDRSLRALGNCLQVRLECRLSQEPSLQNSVGSSLQSAVGEPCSEGVATWVSLTKTGGSESLPKIVHESFFMAMGQWGVHKRAIGSW